MRRFHLSAAFLLLVASAAGAQTTGDNLALQAPTLPIAFDRPESWALKYFASATLLTGLETPSTRKPGSVSVGLELGWLPELSTTQQRVGFDGTKAEDLNKAPVLPRPRVTIGLPDRFALTVAGDPPIRSFGVTPKLFAVALERPVYEATRWLVGVRGYGQVGSVQGAFTCPQSVLAFAPGSANNSYGCQAVSSDTASLRFAGLEVGAAYRPSRLRVSPHVAAAVNYLDLAFQVNATTFGFLDRTRLLSRGATFAASGGFRYLLTNRLDASVDVFYTPLSVQRVFGAPVQNDGLFNVRALVTYRVR
jgi:hypothetical protein